MVHYLCFHGDERFAVLVLRVVHRLNLCRSNDLSPCAAAGACKRFGFHCPGYHRSGMVRVGGFFTFEVSGSIEEGVVCGVDWRVKRWLRPF